MRVTKSEFNEWIFEGKKQGASHMISVLDTFDNTDFPVYILPTEDLEAEKIKYNGVNMLRISEIVDLNKHKH